MKMCNCLLSEYYCPSFTIGDVHTRTEQSSDALTSIWGSVGCQATELQASECPSNPQRYFSELQCHNLTSPRTDPIATNAQFLPPKTGFIRKPSCSAVNEGGCNRCRNVNFTELFACGSVFLVELPIEGPGLLVLLGSSGPFDTMISQIMTERSLMSISKYLLSAENATLKAMSLGWKDATCTWGQSSVVCMHLAHPAGPTTYHCSLPQPT